MMRPAYDLLTQSQREALLENIAQENGFELKQFICFERFGRSTHTAIFEYQGYEFVFVPGASVTLGWDSFVDGMDNATREDIQEAFDEYGLETPLDDYLKQSMSPVRQVTIAPMLVERQVNEIGWQVVCAFDARITENKEYQQYLQEFLQKSGLSEYEIDKEIRFRRLNSGSSKQKTFPARNRSLPEERITFDPAQLEGIEIALYEPVSYEELLASVHDQGLALPTEDEWEYLCGGGSRTLWRFGDSMNYDFRLRHMRVSKNAKEDKPEDLLLPNEFGLEIAYDPYQYEVMEDSDFFLKGGDGGGNLCGGLGAAMGYLPVATSFRSISKDNDPFNYVNEISGDYTFYRRIRRLSVHS